MTQPIDRIAVDGVRLGYTRYGAGSDKPSMVFAHGYAMSSTGGIYDKLLHGLARDYVVYALDLRGHGASAAAVAGWSFEAIADDVVRFARALGLERPVFVGHSFGAVIGLLAAIRQPGAFAALCLLSPGPADHRHDPVDTLDVLIDHGHDREKLRDGFRAMFVQEPGEMLERALDAAVLVDADVHRAQKAQNTHFSIEDRLRDVTEPALLVCGQSDGVVAPERQHDMARKLPCSKEVVFSRAGHMLSVERPTVVAREIELFLSDG